jgi:hypothetical protein
LGSSAPIGRRCSSSNSRGSRRNTLEAIPSRNGRNASPRVRINIGVDGDGRRPGGDKGATIATFESGVSVGGLLAPNGGKDLECGVSVGEGGEHQLTSQEA